MHYPTDFLIHCGVRPERLAELAVMDRLRQALAEANEKLNLSRATSPEDFWLRHVADSLSVGLVEPAILREALAVADVGCGAGFPMLPLAWANPALTVTGIEPHHGKAEFVQSQIDALGLGNCSVLARQAREAGRLPEHAGRYDVVLLRAVGPAGRYVRECRHLLRPSGGAKMIFYKTPQALLDERDLAAREARKFALELGESEVFSLPGDAGERQFLVLRARSPVNPT